MRAAASLLLLLGRLRASLSRAGAGPLMDQVAQAIEEFERDARAGGAPADQVQVAKYALCATADDIVQNLPSDDRHVWTQYRMLAQFFGERTGGVSFFEELDRAKQNPAVNLGLLELMHACLSLGFEGVYRAGRRRRRAAGPAARPLRDDPRAAQPKTIEDLSPHWRGQTHRARRQPVRRCRSGRSAAVAGVAAARRLSPAAQSAQRRRPRRWRSKMAQLHPDTEIAASRARPPRQAAAGRRSREIATQLERIRAALADGDHGRQG